MKHSEEIPAKAKDGSPLPRFLRGLFRGRGAQPEPAGNETGVEPAPEDSTRITPKVEMVDGHCPKVLVVDDDPVILKAVGIKLTKAGCEVVTGQDGVEAIAAARKEHPDVIVLDVNFPPDVTLAWDGIGVMKWLQRVDNGETPPIIIITGLSNEEIRERALAAGAHAFFQKPIDNDGLIGAINRVLDLRRTNGKPAKSSDFTI